MSLSTIKVLSVLVIGLFLGSSCIPGISGGNLLSKEKINNIEPNLDADFSTNYITEESSFDNLEEDLMDVGFYPVSKSKDIGSNNNDNPFQNRSIISFNNQIEGKDSPTYDSLDQYQNEDEYAGSSQYPWWGGSIYYTDESEYNFYAQSFKPTLSTLTRVKLWLFEAWEDNCMDCDFEFYIRKSLYGSDLRSLSKSPEEIPYYSDANWIEFDFEDLAVTPEDTYYIVCKANCGYYIDSTHGCSFSWLYNDSNLYNRGESFIRPSSTYWYYFTGHVRDMCFETYGYNGQIPTADAGGPYNSDVGQNIIFDGSSSYDNDESGAEIIEYNWKFFEGDIWHNTTDSTIEYSYDTDGIYNITLRVWDDEETYDEDYTTITVSNPLPVVDTGGPYYGNPNFPVQFDASDSYDMDEDGYDIVRYDWKFFEGDIWHNNISEYQLYSYDEVKNYSISVRVWDDEGDSNTTNDTIFINYKPHPPTANLRAGEPYISMENDELVHFNASWSQDNDENGSSINRYDWKFFEGDLWHNDLGSNPARYYEDIGEYVVSLRVHDDEGLTDLDESNVQINPYLPPVANANGPYVGMEDTELLFDATGSYDQDEYHHDNNGYYIDCYRWDFDNDGYWDTSWENFSNPIYPYVYLREYFGDAKLQVMDDEGNISSSSVSVSVESYKDPTAYPGGPYYGITNVSLQFDGTGSTDNDQNGQNISLYKWKYYLDDSWHYDGSNPTHLYNSTGTYTVMLNVTDNDLNGYIGYDESTTTVTIEDYQDPIATAGGTYSGQSYTPVIFDASASYDGDENGETIIGYRWDWDNDGIWDTEWKNNPIITHTYYQGYDGIIKLQIKDDDPGENQGYDEDTASITIIGKPPEADFSITPTNNPLIFTFDGSKSSDFRPGYEYYDLTYKWDFNNDGIWDKTGNWDAAGKPTWSYSTSGQKTIKLEVSNVDGSDSTTDSVHAFNYNDIRVKAANGNFFFSYPGSSLPKLKNRYYFTTPTGIFDKVRFEVAGISDVDSSGPYWEGILPMSDADPGDSVRIKGFKNGEQVWSTSISSNIIITPDWFVKFLEENTFHYVNHHNNYAQWKMGVLPTSFGIMYGIDDVPVDNIGGDYELGLSMKTPGQFVIDSSSSLKITKRLVQGSVSLGLKTKDKFKLGDYVGNVKYYGGGSFSYSSDLEISNSRVSLVGYITIEGYGGVSFDIPVFCIPFLAEAGFTGGVRGGIGVGFEVNRFTADGLTFCPGGSSEVYYMIGGNAGLYGEVLAGLARVEGGLEADGKLSFKLPSKQVMITLYVGAYAQASFLWGIVKPEKWTYGETVTLYDSQRGFDAALFDNMSYSKVLKDSRSMDIPCLKDYQRSFDNRLRGSTLLDENVAELAVPKVVLLDSGEGIAVWNDINMSVDGVQSDICWSVYDGTSWGLKQSTGTDFSCEFDPEIKVVRDGDVESVVLTYLTVDGVINLSTDLGCFYAEPRVHTAVWDSEDGWSFNGENILISGGTVNTRSLSSERNGTIFMTYLKDTDSDPLESGIGNIFVVSGTIVNDVTGDYVDWSNPELIESFDSMDIDYQPEIGFVDDQVGGLVYTRWNHTLGLNETVLIPTVSGLSGFADDMLINQSTLDISYTSVMVDENDLSIFWVEDNSRICHAVVTTDSNVNNWIVGDTTVLYENMSVVSLKPVGFNNSRFLLFQRGKDFVPFIIEKTELGEWTNVRRISVDESYSLAQMDGDSNIFESQMIYLRDTNFVNWLVGRWRCNNIENFSVLDSSENDHVGSLIGNSSWVTMENNTLASIYGPCLQFNDTSSYVEVPYDSSLSVSDEFTSTCWINLSDTSSSSDIMGMDGSWKIYQQDGNLGMHLWRTDGELDQPNIANLQSDTWTFIAVTYYHGQLQLIVRPEGYDNTSAVFDLDNYDLVDSGNPLRIGGYVGQLDDAWYFNRDISMSEVDSIWFTPYPKLGSIHDVMVQQMPSFAEILITVRGKRSMNVTTEDSMDFMGSPSGFSFDWDFGDGTTSTGSSVSHQYDAAGTYTIVCNATDPSTGVVTPLSDEIHVSDTSPPVFAGLSTVNAGSTNVTLGWSDASDTSAFVSYYGFMRNDTGSFNYSSPCFTTKNTSYTVENLEPIVTYHFVVRAVDAAGNSDTNTNSLSATPTDNAPPLFDGLRGLYEIENEPGCVLLEWNETSDPSSPVMYHVYMSTSSGGQDYNSPVNATTRSYAMICGLDLESTSYYFVIRAEDSAGNEDSNTVELNTLPENTIPNADFYYTPSNPTAYDIVDFIDNSSDDGYIVNWTWNFNDGNASYEQNPSHNYEEIGEYLVTLTVEDEDGATDSYCEIINVIHIEPSVDFNWTPSSPKIDDLIEFNPIFTNSLNAKSIINYTWAFGDGNYSYESNPKHRYNTEGNYSVCLNVTDDYNGEKYEVCNQLLVVEAVETVDVNQTLFDRGFPIRHATDGDWAGAQSFTPTIDTLTRTELILRKFGTPEFNLTVELRTDNPQGSLVDSRIYTPDQVSSSWEMFEFNFNDTTVQNDTDYFIIIPPAPSGVTTSFGYEWGYAFGNQYDDGAFWFTRDGGGLWRDLPTMYEFAFRTYGYN